MSNLIKLNKFAIRTLERQILIILNLRIRLTTDELNESMPPASVLSFSDRLDRLSMGWRVSSDTFDKSDLKGDKCCFLVEELNQYVEGQLSSSLRSSVEGVVPPLQVLVCSDGFHIHAPSCWWEGTADNPVVIDVLAKCFQGLCCRSSLEVTETSFYFFCWQER